MAANLRDMNFDTVAVHAGNEPHMQDGAVVSPISLSIFDLRPSAKTAAYKYGEDMKCPKHFYSRVSNPSRAVFEKALAACENAKHALAFSSGTAASMAILHLLQRGEEVLHIDDLYSGTKHYFDSLCGSIDVTFSSFSSESDIPNAITSRTKLIWIETMTNPTLKIVDIRNVAAHAKSHGCLFVVDNTFASPYGCNPASLGADVVINSVSKYINGHSDVCMGVLCTNRSDLYERLYFAQVYAGATPSPFDCYLATRGLRTLPLRMRAHEKNAMLCAEFLENHSQVGRVMYPGLKSHPDHETAKSQLRCFSGMISFKLKGGVKASASFMSACRIMTCAVSLGGVESLVEHPALMTHRILSSEQRRELGIDDGLIRLSIGTEHHTDLIEDLSYSLSVAAAASLQNEHSPM